jgi:hypothetical protein
VYQLVRRGYASVQLCPELIPTLLKSHQLLLVELCLRKVPDVPEFSLVQVLKFIISSCSRNVLEEYGRLMSKSGSVDVLPLLSRGSNKNISSKKRKRKSNTSDLSYLLKGVDRILRAVVSAPRSDTLLQTHIRDMSHAEIETLLSFLCKLLRAQKKPKAYPPPTQKDQTHGGEKNNTQEIDAWLLRPAQPTLPQVCNVATRVLAHRLIHILLHFYTRLQNGLRWLLMGISQIL